MELPNPLRLCCWAFIRTCLMLPPIALSDSTYIWIYVNHTALFLPLFVLFILALHTLKEECVMNIFSFYEPYHVTSNCSVDYLSCKASILNMKSTRPLPFLGVLLIWTQIWKASCCSFSCNWKLIWLMNIMKKLSTASTFSDAVPHDALLQQLLGQ